jgi:S1-C subfamily serine protease
MAPRERENGLPKDDNSDMNKQGWKGQRSWRQKPFPERVTLMGKHWSAVGMTVLFLLISAGGVGSARGQDNLPELIKRVVPAVVTVAGFDAAGKVIRVGSGVFIDREGHLITNLHVIKGVARAEVKLFKGEVYPLTEMVAVDEKADLVKVVVNLPGGTPHYLTVSGARPDAGVRVIVLGSPLGLEQTATDGMVSAIRTLRDRGEFLQISAPISPGSSGGPVVNMAGQVIGIATFQVRGQNLNFAVPGYRILALRDGPPRPLPGLGTEGKSLPARPGMNVPRPQMQVR